MDLISQGLSSAKGLNLYRQGIQCVDNMLDSETRNFLTWGVAQEKFKLSLNEMGDWEVLINNL